MAAPDATAPPIASRAGTMCGLAAVVACAAAALLLSWLVAPLSPAVGAVAIGVAVANIGRLPDGWRPAVEAASRRLLRAGVVLLGFQLSITHVIDLGWELAVVVAVVVATFTGTRLLGRGLGLSPGLSTLVATGFSICGVSAIAAMEGVVDAEEEDVATAIALVTLCGTLSLAVLPLLAHPLGLEGRAFGAWAGASVHDVAQAVAVASGAGATALHAAVVVKLSRVALLGPLVAFVALRRGRAAAAATGERLPRFVIAFVVAMAARSAGLVPEASLGGLREVTTVLFSAALAAIGLGVRWSRLRARCGRPLALALLSWVLVAGLAYVGVAVVGG